MKEQESITSGSPAEMTTPVILTTLDPQVAANIAPPGTFVEIRYPIGAANASLHVQPYPGAIDLCDRQPRSPEGGYFEQIDYSTQELQKWVYLPNGCNPKQAVVWINYSDGFGPLSGRLRWITPRAQTVIPFSFPVGSTRWLSVNLADVITTQTSETRFGRK